MKILFITSSRLGDAVLSTGLLQYLRERYPGVRLTIACGRIAAPIFTALPELDRLLVMRKRKALGHWRELWRACIGTRWDMVVDLRGSAIAWLLRAEKRHILQPARFEQHQVVHLGRLLGLEPPPAPTLWTDTNDEARALDLLAGGGPLLALAPAANWLPKTWPIECFIELAARLSAADGALAGARIMVAAAAHERDAVAPLLSTLPDDRIIDLAGTESLTTVYACLKRADLFVGNDSGLMHLAAAADIPTLGLFGPTSDVHYRPWGDAGAVVRTRESYRDIVEAPDFDPRERICRMQSLTVDQADAGARALLERIGARACA